MRCFFLKNGHIINVELMPDLSDKDAIEKAHKLFSEAPEGRFDGFELWQMARFVKRFEATGAIADQSAQVG